MMFNVRSLRIVISDSVHEVIFTFRLRRLAEPEVDQQTSASIYNHAEVA